MNEQHVWLLETTFYWPDKGRYRFNEPKGESWLFTSIGGAAKSLDGWITETKKRLWLEVINRRVEETQIVQILQLAEPWRIEWYEEDRESTSVPRFYVATFPDWPPREDGAPRVPFARIDRLLLREGEGVGRYQRGLRWTSCDAEESEKWRKGKIESMRLVEFPGRRSWLDE